LTHVALEACSKYTLVPDVHPPFGRHQFQSSSNDLDGVRDGLAGTNGPTNLACIDAGQEHHIPFGLSQREIGQRLGQSLDEEYSGDHWIPREVPREEGLFTRKMVLGDHPVFAAMETPIDE
jgi:hypothetical protein